MFRLRLGKSSPTTYDLPYSDKVDSIAEFIQRYGLKVLERDGDEIWFETPDKVTVCYAMIQQK